MEIQTPITPFTNFSLFTATRARKISLIQERIQEIIRVLAGQRKLVHMTGSTMIGIDFSIFLNPTGGGLTKNVFSFYYCFFREKNIYLYIFKYF